MKLIVFGASGQCGTHIVRMAAEHAHRVTAVAREGARIASIAGVEVVRGDVLDPVFVERVVSGHDAVMSGLGMRYRHPWAARQSPDDFISRATANIIASMRRAAVARINVISAAGVGDSRSVLNWPMRLLVATSNVGVAYADLARTERVLASSGLDWQAVRPTTLSNRPGTGRARLTTRYPMTASIPREDVAAFMLQQIEQDHFIGRTPLITVA